MARIYALLCTAPWKLIIAPASLKCFLEMVGMAMLAVAVAHRQFLKPLFIILKATHQ